MEHAGAGFQLSLISAVSTATLGLPCLSVLCWLHPSHPWNISAETFVSKAGRRPHALPLKTALKAGERSFGKDKHTDGSTVGLFLGSLHILNTHGSCCFSSPEHFTPVLMIKLSLPGFHPSPAFLVGIFTFPQASATKKLIFPASLSSCCSHLEAFAAPESD